MVGSWNIVQKHIKVITLTPGVHFDFLHNLNLHNSSLYLSNRS